MSTAIKVVFFDFIGTTVLETRPDVIEDCFQLAFTKNNILVTKHFIQTNRGRNKRDVIQDALSPAHTDLSLVTKILSDFESEVNRHLHYFQTEPSAKQIFSELRDKGILLAIATGLSRHIFDKIMQHEQWNLNWFAYQATYEEIGRGRPHPDMIFDMMRKFNISDAREILKVGDTVADIQEGQQAGTRTAALLMGTQPNARLIQKNPDYTFHQLHEVLSLFA
jgi:HAD superfamily hydrolase (TIGR01549 family)